MGRLIGFATILLICTACGGGGGSSSTTAVNLPVIQSVNLVASLSGEAWPGQTIICSPATSFAIPAGAVTSYEFENATGAAAGGSYVVQSSDIGRYISCRVTIQDPASSGNSATAASTAVSIITQITTPCLVEDANFRTTAGGCRLVSASLSVSRLSPTIHNLGTGTAYCAALRDSGFSDWRLPSGTELSSMLVANRGNFSLNGYSSFMAINFLGAEALADWNGTSLAVYSPVGGSAEWIFCVR